MTQTIVAERRKQFATQSEKTNRYSKDFALPDYLYLPDGSLDREAMLDVVLTEEYGFVRTDGLKVSVEVEFDRPDKPFRHYAGKCEVHKRFRFWFEKDGIKYIHQL